MQLAERDDLLAKVTTSASCTLPRKYLESPSAAVFGKLQHPCINQVLDSLLPAGTKPDCVSPESIFDMVGNVHEWTASAEGTFRGGYYVAVAHGAAYWDFSTGFRCCAVGEL